MIFDYHKDFKKAFEKLDSKRQKKVNQALMVLKSNAHHPSLKNHALKGGMKGSRSISAGGDLRIIFTEYENYTLVFFLDVGSHNQVY